MKLAADPDHGPQPLRVALHQRHHDGRAEIAQARGNGADDANVPAAGEFGNGRVVLLKDTIRQREALFCLGLAIGEPRAGGFRKTQVAYPKDRLQT